MIIRFTRGAKADLLESLRYMDGQGPRRGRRFRELFRKAVSDIKATPESWPRIYKLVRIRIIKAFKYAIYYEIEEDGPVWIGAVMHLKRKAASWKRRFKKPKK